MFGPRMEDNIKTDHKEHRGGEDCNSNGSGEGSVADSCEHGN